jgi:hypothetical protein
MTLPRVPLDSSNERQHRTILATTVNELVKVRPPNDRTPAEIAAGVTPVDYGYPFGDVRRYGIAMDSSDAGASNAEILNDLSAAAWPNPIVLTFPDGEIYIADQVDFSAGNIAILFSDCTEMYYTGVATQPAFIFTGQALTNFWLECSTAHDWSDEDCVGLRIINTRRRDIHIRRLAGFTINLQAWGSSTSGIGYNFITMLGSFDAKYHVDIHSSVANGWINENEWHLLGIDNTGSYPTDENSYGVRFKAESGAYQGINNNVFYKPSFELEDGDSGTERIPVWFDNAGIRNKFYDARIENGRGAVLKISSDAYEVAYNEMDLCTLIGSQFTGSDNPALVMNTDGGLGFANYLHMTRWASHFISEWHSGDLVEKSFAASSSRIQTRDVFHHASGDVERYDGTARIHNRWLRLGSISMALGVFADTTRHKEFIVKVNSHEDYQANVAIVCYDSSGNVLDDGDSGHPFVAASSTLTASTSWTYSYRTTGANVGLLQFRVGSTVAKIKVMVNGSADGVLVNSFHLAAVQQSIRPVPISVWSGFDCGRLVDDSPATIRNGGYSLRGTLAFNDDAASAAVSYWQCTASGWNATAWAATTAYALDAMVENDTGKVYVCRTAGTSAGAGGPTGTTTGITDNTVTWDYIGTLATWTAGPSNP